MIQLHIIAGLVSLLAGFVALYASKGAWLHRRSGQVFTGAMLSMAGSGALIALFLRQPTQCDRRDSHLLSRGDRPARRAPARG